MLYRTLLYGVKDPLCEGLFLTRIGTVDLRELTRVPRWSPAAASSCPCPADGPAQLRWREGAGRKHFLIMLCAAALGWLRDAVRWVGALREGKPTVGSSAGWMLLRAARQPGNPSTHIKLTTCLHRFVGVAILQPAWSSSTACKLAAWHSFWRAGAGLHALHAVVYGSNWVRGARTDARGARGDGIGLCV